MRTTIQTQMPIVNPYIDHDHAQELEAISEILDTEPAIVGLVYDDLIRGGIEADNGREGMTAEQVLRALIVKQMNEFSYEELAFHLVDSSTYSAFCRFGFGRKSVPRSTLQRNIKRVRPETMEGVNRLLLYRACEEGIERGRKVRIDTTVTESNIHEPSESELLWDSVRVLVRLMGRAKDLVGIRFTDHSRRAKRRRLGILHARGKKERVKHYRDLLKVTRKTVTDAGRAVETLEQCRPTERMAADRLAAQMCEYIELVGRVISQAERRVLKGEKVPATEKVVSIFEPHTDIIVKDRRDTHYGHKLTLSCGGSGLVLDCVVEEGNPADSTLAVRMVERQEDLFGRPPRQVALDGGFASTVNLRDIKELGVKDVAFSKRRGLKVADMVKSAWVYRRLRRFRAGIEGIISFLKRCFGMDRCTWRGGTSFKAYAWASVVSMNLVLLARHKLASRLV